MSKEEKLALQELNLLKELQEFKLLQMKGEDGQLMIQSRHNGKTYIVLSTEQA